MITMCARIRLWVSRLLAVRMYRCLLVFVKFLVMVVILSVLNVSRILLC